MPEPVLIPLEWLSKNGVQWHGDIKITRNDHSGVLVVANAPIAHPSRVATIPKAAVLSPRSCALSNRITWVPYGHGAVLALALALYSEMLMGSRSRWHGYICSLPAGIVPIARLWGHREAFPDEEDAQEAATWLHGTEVQNEMNDEEGNAFLDIIGQYYTSEARPILESASFHPTLQGFLRAYALVCSRAFLVDAYHGLSMVPLADAFNHTNENHVQLASEYDVCPACGSLTECPHDADDDPPPSMGTAPSPPSAPEGDADTVDMVTVRPVEAGSEVFNTYGATLGNAALLARYGFLLEGGEADVVTFGWPGSGLVVEREERKLLRECANGEVEEALEGSELVYFPDGEEERLALSVNGDGQVSAGLFVWAVRGSLKQAHLVDASWEALVTRTCQALLATEARRNTDEREDNMDTDEEGVVDDLAYQILATAAAALVHLCESRASQTGKMGYQGLDILRLGDVLDGLPQGRPKTRLALEYLLGERALLQACVAGWRDIQSLVM